MNKAHEECKLSGSKENSRVLDRRKDVARRINPIYQDNEYTVLVEKLVQLEPYDWPKFPDNLKKLHLAEFYQAQSQWQKVTINNKSNKVV